MVSVDESVLVAQEAWAKGKKSIIHLQSVVLALTSRVSNKVYQQEFAKRGGGGWGKLIYRGYTKTGIGSESNDDGNVNENGKKELKV